MSRNGYAVVCCGTTRPAKAGTPVGSGAAKAGTPVGRAAAKAGTPVGWGAAKAGTPVSRGGLMACGSHAAAYGLLR